MQCEDDRRKQTRVVAEADRNDADVMTFLDAALAHPFAGETDEDAGGLIATPRPSDD